MSTLGCPEIRITTWLPKIRDPSDPTHAVLGWNHIWWRPCADCLHDDKLPPHRWCTVEEEIVRRLRRGCPVIGLDRWWVYWHFTIGQGWHTLAGAS